MVVILFLFCLNKIFPLTVSELFKLELGISTLIYKFDFASFNINFFDIFLSDLSFSNLMFIESSKNLPFKLILSLFFLFLYFKFIFLMLAINCFLSKKLISDFSNITG